MVAQAQSAGTAAAGGDARPTGRVRAAGTPRAPTSALHHPEAPTFRDEESAEAPTSWKPDASPPHMMPSIIKFRAVWVLSISWGISRWEPKRITERLGTVRDIATWRCRHEGIAPRAAGGACGAGAAAAVGLPRGRAGRPVRHRQAPVRQHRRLR